ncbi:hypothetical protein B4U80_13662 [Leptotrombidium deliense]|uniref:F-box domain-containing protein n=1 Tax=Leptotrombidium deliense TaxID=299467 RepID=A0A443SND0_9ACAR|nr:hypothetical protein B4U80_13662 [Leptotrombidium deliense]
MNVESDVSMTSIEEDMDAFNNFVSLPCELLSLILRLLDTKDLLVWRSVSKSTQLLTDFLVRNRKHELIFNYSNEMISKEQLNFLCSYFIKIKKLSVANPNIRFDDIVNVYKKKISGLSFLEIGHLTTCTDMNIHWISYCFPNITTLVLTCVPINDESVANLFRTLPALKTVELDRVSITGKCFSELSCSVTNLNWTLHGEIEICDDISFSKNGVGRIEEFSFQVAGSQEEDRVNIASVIARDMRNIKCLRLLDMWVLNDIHQLCLSTNLQELDIRVSEVFGDYGFERPIFSLRKLSFDIINLNEVNLLTFLLNFPYVEDLSLFFSIGCEVILTEDIIQALLDLRKLKTLSFEDSNYESEEYFIFENAPEHALIRLLHLLTGVTKFTIVLGNAFTNQNYDLIESAIEKLKSERPQVLFTTDFV